MINRRLRPFGFAAAALVAIWLVAWGGYRLAHDSKMTADKFRHYVQSVDFASLSGAARANALRALIGKLNALPPDDRRQMRLGRDWEGWFKAMTEAEKAQFIEATLPSGFKQMLAAFEELPEARRKRTIDDAFKRLREEQAGGPPGPAGQAAMDLGTNAPLVLSEGLRQQATTIGLQSFYSESSAQTKAELAPLLEELQRSMQSGTAFRGGRR